MRTKVNQKHFSHQNDVITTVDAALPGWTLLIHTGTYPEKITAAKPLTLKADGGPVTIGNN
ncbi:MAG: hypothetical protein ABMA02_18555 [Saprospiraceae bacterium]